MNFFLYQGSIQLFFGAYKRRNNSFKLRHLRKDGVFELLFPVIINYFVLADRKQKCLDSALSLKIADGLQKCIKCVLQDLLRIFLISSFSGDEAREFRSVPPVKHKEGPAIPQ